MKLRRALATIVLLAGLGLLALGLVPRHDLAKWTVKNKEDVLAGRAKPRYEMAFSGGIYQNQLTEQGEVSDLHLQYLASYFSLTRRNGRLVDKDERTLCES